MHLCVWLLVLAIGAGRCHGTSAFSCTNLDLTPQWKTSCGKADVSGCMVNATYEEAVTQCFDAGMRLCRLSELTNNCLKTAGCSFETAHIWSSTVSGCATEEQQVFVGDNANSGTYPGECRSVINETAAVGCCADMIPSFRNCKESPWNAWPKTGEICASPTLAPLDSCPEPMTYSEATDRCQVAGARLCSLSEVATGNLLAAGCDIEDTWTATTAGCPTGDVMVLPIDGSTPPNCSSTYVNLHQVMCCAEDPPIEPDVDFPLVLFTGNSYTGNYIKLQHGIEAKFHDHVANGPRYWRYRSFKVLPGMTLNWRVEGSTNRNKGEGSHDTANIWSYACGTNTNIGGSSGIYLCSWGHWSHKYYVKAVASTSCEAGCAKCAATECFQCTDATMVSNSGTNGCRCATGYYDSGSACVDTNECLDPLLNNCHEHAICQNVPGYYGCICEHHYVGNGFHCDYDECSAGVDVCHASALCLNTEGSYACACPEGYSGDGVDPCDYDQCYTDDRNNCHEHAVCTKLPGTYSCACKPLYSGNGVTACDFDECLAGHNCDVDVGMCVNLPTPHGGNFTCTCPDHYVWNGSTCAEVPCDTTPPAHGHNGTCPDALPWSSSCSFTCEDGYYLNGDEMECVGGAHERQECTQCTLIPFCVDTRCTEAGDQQCHQCDPETGWSGPLCDVCEDPQFWGPQCSKPCLCVRGVCNSGFGGTGLCSSCPENTGWGGINCDYCLGDVDGLSGWSNSSMGCDTCEGWWWGPTCMAKCACVPGAALGCDAGLEGTGECTCEPGTGWGGSACEVCAPNWYGPECSQNCVCPLDTGICDDGVTGNGFCKSCKPGHTGPMCDQCPNGTFSELPTTSTVPCATCPVGTFAQRGAVQCTPCAPGYHTPFTGTTECVACPAGYSARSPGALACTECAAGWYSESPGSPDCIQCPPGMFSASPGSSSCDVCPEGMYSGLGSTACLPCPKGFRSPDSVICEPCPQGHYSPHDNSRACLPCPIGRFADSEATFECTRCDRGTFQDEEGKTECKSCGVGMTTAQRASHLARNCTCAPGFHRRPGVPGPERGTNARPGCEDCPRGGSCRGDELDAIAAPGFYASDSADFTFVDCSPPESCSGAQECSEGNGGYRCGDCSPGYYALELRCVKCPDDAAYRIAGAAMAAIMFCLIVILGNRKRAMMMEAFSDTLISRLLSVAGIFVTFGQILASFSTFNLRWPKMLLDLFAIFSILNLNIELLGPECAAQTTWELKYILVLLLLPAFGIALLVIAGVALLISHLRKQSPFFTMDHVISAFVQVTTFTYIITAGNALRFFDCSRQADGTYALDSAPSQRCFDDWWYGLLPLASTFAVLYVVGIPLAFAGIVLYYRKNLGPKGDDDTRKHFIRRYGPLTERFKDGVLFWELIIMARKLGIIASRVLFSGDPIFQALVAAVVLATTLLLHSRRYPFVTRSQNVLEGFLIVVCLIVIVSGLAFFNMGDTETSTEAVLGYALVVAIISSLIAVMGAVAAIIARYDQHDAEMDEWLESEEELTSDVEDEVFSSNVMVPMALAEEVDDLGFSLHCSSILPPSPDGKLGDSCCSGRSDESSRVLIG